MPDGTPPDGAHREAHGERQEARSRHEPWRRDAPPGADLHDVIPRPRPTSPNTTLPTPAPAGVTRGTHTRGARTGGLSPTQAPVGNGGPPPSDRRFRFRGSRTGQDVQPLVWVTLSAAAPSLASTTVSPRSVSIWAMSVPTSGSILDHENGFAA